MGCSIALKEPRLCFVKICLTVYFLIPTDPATAQILNRQFFQIIAPIFSKFVCFWGARSSWAQIVCDDFSVLINHSNIWVCGKHSSQYSSFNKAYISVADFPSLTLTSSFPWTHEHVFGGARIQGPLWNKATAQLSEARPLRW